jgi:LytS/YehU family sensor histidine kinase
MTKRLRGWLALWAGWTALGLFLAVSTSLSYISTGRSGSWGITIGRSLSEWWLWALLTPVVAALARRWPVHGPRRWRHLTAHLAIGAAIAAAKTVADRAVFGWISGFWMYLLASTAALQLVVYAAIVAGAHLVTYYRTSREREQLEARLAEARLQLLNMQLQPHFLFNTLNTIAELVHEDPETADRMITELSALLRRTMDLGRTPDVRLEAELDLLTLYLSLQKARFGDRLETSVTVDDGVRQARVPLLLLQPIVENAIRHGLARHVAAGRLEISARRAGNELAIDVTDDGPGVTDEQVREGIGLGNTRARLDALYPGASTLSLTNVAGGGARVSVRLPYRTDPDPA